MYVNENTRIYTHTHAHTHTHIYIYIPTSASTVSSSFSIALDNWTSSTPTKAINEWMCMYVCMHVVYMYATM